MIFKQLNERVQRLAWWDLGAIKITVIAFTLMMAKLIPQLLVLEWWIYGIVFFVFYAYLIKKVWF